MITVVRGVWERVQLVPEGSSGLCIDMSLNIGFVAGERLGRDQE